MHAAGRADVASSWPRRSDLWPGAAPPVAPNRLLVFSEADAFERPAGSRDFGALVEGAPRRRPRAAEAPRIEDPVAYIYTSGTTGLPKAATLTNQRMLRSMHVFARVVAGIEPKDVVYSPGLPFYHSSGTMVAFGMALVPGATLAFGRPSSSALRSPRCGSSTERPRATWVSSTWTRSRACSGESSPVRRW